jgi:F0F1-type ATP synthase assembly protein I
VAASGPTSSSSSSSSSNTTGLIVGLVVGLGCGVLILAALSFYFRYKKLNKN